MYLLYIKYTKITLLPTNTNIQHEKLCSNFKIFKWVLSFIPSNFKLEKWLLLVNEIRFSFSRRFLDYISPKTYENTTAVGC